MELGTPKNHEDIKEKQLITRYIDKAFSAVKNANSALALLEKRVTKQNTMAKLQLETDTLGESTELMA